MRTFVFLSLVLCIGALQPVVPMGSPTAAQTAPAAALAVVDCAPAIAPNPGTASDITCYRLAVPERHANPDGPQIGLFIVRIHASASTPNPDPLVIEPGGPGISIVQSVPAVLGMEAIHQNRDIILVEQRGIGLSEPALECPALLDWASDILTGAAASSEPATTANTDYLAGLAACYVDWAAQGVDLSAYNSLESAADIVMALNALGYETFNYLGGSYATMLGQHILRDFPEAVRSVILEAPVPLPGSFITTSPYTVDRAFQRLFAACAAEPDCAARYPDLETVFFTLVDTYNAEPLTVQFTRPIALTARIDGDTLIRMLFNHLYDSVSIPALPALIYALRAGDTRFITDFAPGRLIGVPSLAGMYYSVICSEDNRYEDGDFITGGVDPRIVRAFRDYLDVRPACAVWQVDALPDTVDQPIASTVPALILAGDYDPITPPENSAILAESLANAHTAALPWTGHIIAFRGGCVTDMLSAFLDNPSVAPDTACLDGLARSFIVETETVQDVQLEPVDQPEYGIRVLVPQGWQAVGGGVFLAPDNAAFVELVRLPDSPLTVQQAEWAAWLNLDSFPPPASELSIGDRSWTFYRFDAMVGGVGRMEIGMAVTEIDGVLYFAGLYAQADRFDALYAAVLLPTLEAWTLLDG